MLGNMMQKYSFKRSTGYNDNLTENTKYLLKHKKTAGHHGLTKLCLCQHYQRIISHCQIGIVGARQRVTNIVSSHDGEHCASSIYYDVVGWCGNCLDCDVEFDDVW